MTRAEFDRLLSAYSSGSISKQEQETLFQAAMEDQSFFNALGDEESLRDVLQDPALRSELKRELEARPAKSFWPWALAFGGAFASALLGAFLVWRAQAPRVASETKVEMAMDRVSKPSEDRVIPPSAPARKSGVSNGPAAAPARREKQEVARSIAVPEPPKPEPVLIEAPKDVATPKGGVVGGVPPGVAGARPGSGGGARLSAMREAQEFSKPVVTAFRGPAKPLQHTLADGVLTVTASRDGYLYVLTTSGGNWKTAEAGTKIAAGVSRPVRVDDAKQAFIALTAQPVSEPTMQLIQESPGAFFEIVNLR